MENSITRWFVHSLASFDWDGLAMWLRLIEIIGSVTDFHYAAFHWLANIWLLQHKCGGADTSAY
jgi:hypothetical protein